MPVDRHHQNSKTDEMNTPPEKQKEKHHKSKKTYQQREEATEYNKKDAVNSQNKQQSQTEKLSVEKDHYHGIEQYHYLARERRRKSRSERNKRRERHKQAQQKTDPKEQSEFRRHIRNAQEITSRSTVDHSNLKAEAKPVTVITQNRLTRKLGLFNQGKKSSKISRDTIIVPESVQSRVEKDLKEIINQKSSTEAYSVISVNERNEPSCKSLSCEQSVDDEERSHQSSHLPTTPSSAPKPSPSKSWATTSPESQISGITKLPETPPWAEISKDFEESLNIEEIFPDKEDYLNTVYRDLKKMIEIYGPSQEIRSQLVTKRRTEIPEKVSKLSVRRRLEDAFAREEGMKQDGVPTTVAESVGKQHLESVTDKHFEDMPHQETVPTRSKTEDHRNKKTASSTEELMNAMMDGLQFLKNADEVNKIWSTSRSKLHRQDLNESNTSELNFYQYVGTGTSSIGTSAPNGRQRHNYITERHRSEAPGIRQEYFTACSRDRVYPVLGSDYHQREWREESLDCHHQQRRERRVYGNQVKSDMRMKNVTEADIFASSSYHHPSVSSFHGTHAPVGNSPPIDMSHDTHLLSPHLRRRQRYPFKRFRMMESSDTDDDEDDELFPEWYMDVDPPKMSAIESPKFYPQKMF